VPLILIFSSSFSTTPSALSLLARVAGSHGARARPWRACRRCGPLLPAAKRAVMCWSLAQHGLSLPAARRDRTRGACWYEHDRASATKERSSSRERRSRCGGVARPAPRCDSVGGRWISVLPRGGTCGIFGSGSVVPRR
jgi:hypothetical protein